MTRSELIQACAYSCPELPYVQVEEAVKHLLSSIGQSIAAGQRVEVRGFGSFILHSHESRVGRNPRTGESVWLQKRHAPRFRAGKGLRERVNINYTQQSTDDFNDRMG